MRALRIPYAGLSHSERALIASSLYVRQDGDMGDALIRPTLGLLDMEQLSWIRVTGLALRLAHTISGGAPGLLAQTQLRVTKDKLFLSVNDDHRGALISEAVERRVKTLARALGKKGRVE